MTARSSQAPGALYRWARRHFNALSWAAVGVAFVTTMTLGFVGFTASNPELPISTRAYLALQLLTMESGGVEGSVPLSLELARWAGVLTSLGTIASTLLAVFERRIQKFLLRRMKGHAVIVGAGEAGVQLATDLLAEGRRVAILEKDESNAAIPTLVDRGAHVAIGDAQDQEALEAAAVRNAETVIVVAGSDTLDLEIVSAIRDACAERRAPQPLRCYVHIVNERIARLSDALMRDGSASSKLEVSTFSRFTNSVRLLLDEAPLDRERIVAGDDRRVHLVIVDLGPLGEALLRQALAIGHYANDLPLSVTVIDEAAAEKEQALRARIPELHECADLTFLEGDLHDEAIRRRLGDALDDERQIVSVAVCPEDAQEALIACMDVIPLMTDFNDTLFVNLANDERVASLLSLSRSTPIHVVAFGSPREACSARAVLRRELDVLARKIHDEYRARRIHDGDSEEKFPALRPWDELDADFRDANRQQADHVPVKLRALGCTIVAVPTDASAEPVRFGDEEIEALARAEHRRWCTNRRLAGYRFGQKRDDAAKIHSDLVPWEALDEPTREYDREPVRNLPKLLAAVGYGIERPPG